MKKVVVFGGNSQLAQCLKKVEDFFPTLEIIYVSSKNASIVDVEALTSVFDKHQPQIIINCGAYTAVDLAEDEIEEATRINTDGPRNLAQLCEKHGASLIHISTDFVFEGNHARALTENDETNPLSVYGKTKLDGESEIINNASRYIILRTSWLYSEFGNNFVKTMLRLGKERESLGVVADQLGTPTYAVDLAKVILSIASKEEPEYGVFHYSNEGVASWFDFAHAIFKIANLKLNLEPLSSSEFPTKAVRPAFSVLDKSKIKTQFSIQIPHWQDSLEDCLRNINQKTR